MALPLRLAPSLLAADFAHLGDAISAVEAAGGDLLIHVDVMDGSFVPNISFGLPVAEAARRVTALPLDTHLMVVHPERHIETFAAAGVTGLTVHVETCPHLHRVVQQIREAGVRPAVALNPATPAVMVEEILPFVDMVLVMTVNPGYGGQKFMPEMLDKVRRVRDMADARGLAIDIQVDGGVDARTAPLLVSAGANVLVAGTSIFHAPGGPRAGIEAIRQACLAV